MANARPSTPGCDLHEWSAFWIFTIIHELLYQLRFLYILLRFSTYIFLRVILRYITKFMLKKCRCCMYSCDTAERTETGARDVTAVAWLPCSAAFSQPIQSSVRYSAFVQRQLHSESYFSFTSVRLQCVQTWQVLSITTCRLQCAFDMSLLNYLLRLKIRS